MPATQVTIRLQLASPRVGGRHSGSRSRQGFGRGSFGGLADRRYRRDGRLDPTRHYRMTQTPTPIDPQTLTPPARRLVDAMCSAASIDPTAAMTDDTLVGFFQAFRPDGEGIENVFDAIDGGSETAVRLSAVFQAAGDGRRPAGGRDAYFVVRNPLCLTPEAVQHNATTWLTKIASLGRAVDGHCPAAETIANASVRVLEGIPPKAPKAAVDQSELFLAMRDVMPTWTAALTPDGSPADVLRGPFYFVACDAALRDFLLWPLLSVDKSFADPTVDYFRLWSAGVKWRIFTDDRVDFYIPRNNTAVAAPAVV